MLKTAMRGSLIVAVALLGKNASADEPKANDQTKTGKHVAESQVFFEFNSDELTAVAREELDKAAHWIESNQTGLILVEGHTDKVGAAEYNKELGERRAEAAKSYLVARGVPAARIRVLSYGEGLPATETEDEAKANRRIVLFAVQKEPIVQEKSKVVVQEVPVLEKVYIDRAVERKPIGLQLMVGGGLTNQLDDETEEVTELGGTWDARVAYRNQSLIGVEAAYLGSVQTVNAFGLDDNAQLLGNGAEVDVRFNLLRDTLVRPYLFTGVGWMHYDLTNTETANAAVEDNDDVFHIPAGAGVGFHLYRGVTLDVRGTLRATFDDEVFAPMSQPDDEMGLENWATTAQLGFEF